jgi:hypothetical protein
MNRKDGQSLKRRYRNPERQKRLTKKWQAANRRKVKRSQKKWYSKNRKKSKARAKRWRRLNLARARLHDILRSLKHKYGISIEERDALFSENGGKCWVCNVNVSTRIDHDHSTGKIRGALCNGCNAGLGMFAEDTKRLTAAIDYLEKARAD